MLSRQDISAGVAPTPDPQRCHNWPNMATPKQSEIVSLGPLRYQNPRYTDLPHMISFSGGRSSAMVAMAAAQEGLLNADRGDVLLFANTSAEHPGTYEFAARCKETLEREHGIPFLWYEFCTVEDLVSGGYTRLLSYRLVKPVPIEDDPLGYRSSGEVFEEMATYQKMLPTPHQRTCTAKMKLLPAHELMSEWLGRTAGPQHSGHYWDESLVDVDRATAKYAKNNSHGPSVDSYRQKLESLSAMPTSRPEQKWQDYTAAQIRWDGAGSAPVPVRGKSAAQWVKTLGLRFDEPKRVERVISRTLFAEGATTAKCTVKNQPPGEHPIFPLYDAGIVSDDVKSFWAAQPFDLDIPDGAGNCVYCFMKGTNALAGLAVLPDPRRRQNTPSDINWWADFEQRHARQRPCRDNPQDTVMFGFLGANQTTFADIAAGAAEPADRHAVGTMACDCTD